MTTRKAGSARGNKAFLFSWGELDYAPSHFRLPRYICLDNQGRIWIADRENSRPQILDANGKFLDQWEDFLRPTDVKIDKNDTVYVTELYQRVSILSIDGKVLTRFGNQRGKDQKTALFLAPHTVIYTSVRSFGPGQRVNSTAAPKSCRSSPGNKIYVHFPLPVF